MDYPLSAMLTRPLQRFPSQAFSWTAELLIVSVSFLVFSILHLVDRLLCLVFWAFDSVLDSDIFPCYCKHRVNGALPRPHSQTHHPALSLLREGGYGDECRIGSLTYAGGDPPSHVTDAHGSRERVIEGCPSLFKDIHGSGDRSLHAKDIHGSGDCSTHARHADGSLHHPPHADHACYIHKNENCSSHAKQPGLRDERVVQSSEANHVYCSHGNEDLSVHVQHAQDSRAGDCRSDANHFHLLVDKDDSTYTSPIVHPTISGQTEWDATMLMPHLHSHVRLTAGGGHEAGIHNPMSLERTSEFPRRTMSRWSDCGCSTCTSWQSDEKELLYVHVEGKGQENVVFIHGFLSSSALWSEEVIPHLPDTARASYRLFGVDLLGFGKSPKPRSCSYNMADHIMKIEESVLHRYNIDSFHLVAHSMGCIVALALAAAHVDSIKTITLVAPPYFPAPANEAAASYVLRQLAPRRIWPLTAFGASVMSWYEHVGRGLCFLLCKHHRVWEFVLNTLTLNRISRSAVRDFMQHTHHSAWHIFHNVICGEAHALDGYLSTLERGGCNIHVLHGKNDTVVPARCSYQLEKRYRNVKLEVVDSANHFTIIYGQEKLFSRTLEKNWRNEMSNAISSKKL